LRRTEIFVSFVLREIFDCRIFIASIESNRPAKNKAQLQGQRGAAGALVCAAIFILI
jgi:hypothetical protein